MNDNAKINLLNEELDEESAKYITEQINQWKENVLGTLQEQVETAKAEKLDELEKLNEEYREELKEEYSDKLIEAISQLRESVKADVTAKILKNNPELKILEQIKELIAPTLSEDYKADAYSETIEQLAEENATLKRNAEIMEGAETLSELLAPYNQKTQNLVLSLIKEGNSEEVREQFVDIMSSLEDMVSEGEEEPEEVEDEKEDEDDIDADDKKKDKKKKEDNDEDEDDDEGDEGDDDNLGESFIDEGYEGSEDIFLEDENVEDENIGSMKNMIKSYI